MKTKLIGGLHCTNKKGQNLTVHYTQERVSVCYDSNNASFCYTLDSDWDNTRGQYATDEIAFNAGLRERFPDRFEIIDQ